ncbi:hypothetical protein MAR_035338 [Mya arenaria]|uniref:Uncharacterized protein n=1 Tax=Mya arenaria TaxID=6604 RepID=A0ABY7EMM3_MYAAR|nr:hypothetical protein MAR_035338 [Mya arenaria]
MEMGFLALAVLLLSSATTRSCADPKQKYFPTVEEGCRRRTINGSSAIVCFCQADLCNQQDLEPI